MKLDSLLDLVFPPACVNCEARIHTREPLCAACASSITLHQTFFCGTCRARLPEAKRVCHPAAPYLLGAAADYASDPIRSLIHALKFEYAQNAGLFLGNLLARYAASLGFDWRERVVVPIPLGERRARERGFNQSGLIAERLAATLGCRLETKNLLRSRNTAPQSELKEMEERRGNVEGCFALRNAEALKGVRVVLVDDVTTSGATLHEAARTLRAAGARGIVALTIAKT